MDKVATLARVQLYISFLFLILSIFALNLVETEILDQKVKEVENGIGRIEGYVSSEIAADQDWGEYDYESRIADLASSYDSEYMTFACLYRNTVPGDREGDSPYIVEMAVNGAEYTILSSRNPSYEQSLFDPLAHPAFMNSILSGEKSGKVLVKFEDKEHGVNARDMQVCYQYIPSLETDPFLFVVAVSRYSVDIHASWMLYVIFFGQVIAVGAIALLAGREIRRIKNAHSPSLYKSKYRG